jgi:hypothetical protein
MVISHLSKIIFEKSLSYFYLLKISAEGMEKSVSCHFFTFIWSLVSHIFYAAKFYQILY